MIAADGDVTRFVVAGDDWSNRAGLAGRIHVEEDASGYDGQFFYRLAIDPSELQFGERQGVTFDQPYRLGRIRYPLVAWAVSLGQPDLVPWGLVVTNVLALGVLAFLGTLVALRVLG
jgi:hypothetical protein